MTCMKIQFVRVNKIQIRDWGFLHIYEILMVESWYEYENPSQNSFNFVTYKNAGNG